MAKRQNTHPHAARKERFKRALAKRFFLRFHMSLILGTTVLSGMAINRLLLGLGLEEMGLRYGAAVIASYLVFLLCIRLWLTYITTAHRRAATVGHGGDVLVHVPDAIADIGHAIGRSIGHSGSPGRTSTPPATGEAGGGTFFGTGESSGTGEAAGADFFGSGGSQAGGEAAGADFFGGGTNSASGQASGGTFFSADSDSRKGGKESGQAIGAVWLDSMADEGGPVAAGAGRGPARGGGGGWFDDFNFDVDEPGALAALLALAAIVAVVAGAGVYLIWEAPTILAEAAFEVALVWSLKKRAQHVDTVAWIGSVTKATIIPFAIVLVLTVGTGMYLEMAYPQARTLSDVSNYEQLFPADSSR